MVSKPEGFIDVLSPPPLIEQIPELGPLKKMDGQGFVRCHLEGGIELSFTSFAYDSYNGLYGGKMHYVFGAFNFDDLMPVAACRYVQGNASWVECSTFNPVTFRKAQPYGLVENLPKVFEGLSQDRYDGFLVVPGMRGKGIGQIMLAFSMVVLESLGYDKSVFVYDRTAHPKYDDQSLLSLVQTSMTGEGTVQYNSFYTKISEGGRVELDVKGSHNTYLPTRISSKQAELIQRAFMRKEP